MLAHFGKDGVPETVIPKISQESLAEMIGTTRSQVSSFMNRFRKLGFIHYNGGLEVHSSLLSVVLRDWLLRRHAEDRSSARRIREQSLPIPVLFLLSQRGAPYSHHRARIL
jgi:CRP/FNR family transcriptional regulator, cyclic AMP receptor protein